MSEDLSVDTLQQPVEVRSGHLTEWRARLEDDRVSIRQQMYMHRFDSGKHPTGPSRRVWSGTLREAKQLHALLDKLLRPEAYPHEWNHAEGDWLGDLDAE